MEKPAETSVPIADFIAKRWSPRALDETATVSWDQLRAMLEAARWAASSGNTQPARYLVGLRGDETFRKIFDSLTDGNKRWAHRASALLVAVMVTRNEKGDISHAEYGLGLAGQNLVLEAINQGLVAHQMAGFDPAAIQRDFDLPEYAVARVAIAVGSYAEPEVLGDERSVSREVAQRKRIPLSEFAFTGSWGNSAF
jgi:nitroreductase